MATTILRRFIVGFFLGVAAFVLLLLAGMSQARSSNPPCSPDTINPQVIAYQHHAPTPIGYRSSLVGIGRPGYRNPAPAMLASYGPYEPECIAAKQAALYLGWFSSTHRFYVALAAFPAAPTRAQWTAKWPVIVRLAIASDVAAYHVNGLPPCAAPSNLEKGHEKILCTGLAGRLMTDVAWLTKVEHAPYGTRIS